MNIIPAISNETVAFLQDRRLRSEAQISLERMKKYPEILTQKDASIILWLQFENGFKEIKCHGIKAVLRSGGIAYYLILEELPPKGQKLKSFSIIDLNPVWGSELNTLDENSQDWADRSSYHLIVHLIGEKKTPWLHWG